MNRRRLNGKALLILVLSAAALAGGAHLAHAFQVKRNAAAMIDQARQAEHEGEARQAAWYLQQYISLEPNDTDARARYGLLLHSSANTQQEHLRAYLTLEEVLRRDSGRADVRRAAVELAVRFGRFVEARGYLKTLMAESPADAELVLLLGRCELRAARLNEAAECFSRIGRLAPDRVDLCVTSADILRRNLQRPMAADQVIDQMVGAAPQSLPVRLAAARYHTQWANWDQVDKQVRYAFDTLKAQSPELSLMAGEAAIALNRPDNARTLLESGLKLYPSDLHLRQLLARVELLAGRKDKAKEVADPIAADAPKSLRELWAQANLMIDLGQIDKAQDSIKQIEALPGPAATAMGRCLRGQMLLQQKAWGEARVVLEKARAATLAEPELNRRANLLLAECYYQQGNTDQLLIAYRQVLKIDPLNAAARRGVAGALAAIGKTDEAIAAYRVLAADAPDVRVDFARVLLNRTRRLPAADRDWTNFDQLLQEMSVQQRETPAVRQMQFEALIARGKRDEARLLIEAERDRDPKQVAPWLLLIGLGGRDKSPAIVPALLAEAEKQAGWHVEWELARANQVLRMAAAGGATAENAVAQLKEIEAAAGRCSDADKARLLAGLAEAAQSTGDRVNSRRLWRDVADKVVDKQAAQFALFELALQDGDATEAARLRDAIRGGEGADGPVGSYCEAAYQMIEARKGSRTAMLAARAAVNHAAEQRPSWSRVSLLDGNVCELEGRRDKALEKYQEAMDHGDQRLPVVRRVLQLLYEEHRYAEAHALLKKVPEPVLSQTDLGRIAAELFVVSPDEAGGVDAAASRTRALQLAQQAVTADSKDYAGLLWLGHLAAQAGQPDEAERAFRRAVEVADTVPDTWASLTLFLARTDPKKAEVELEKAKLKLAKDKLPLALAPGYEALGRIETAEEQYRAALDARPSDPAVLRFVASFYGRTGQSAKAIPVLQRLIDPQTQTPAATVAWARRCLAVSLPAMGNYHQFKEAVALIEANSAGGAPPVEDRLAKALLLARQPSHRKEAIVLFETVPIRKGALPPDAEFLLAQLYEADGDWPKAHAHLLALVTEQDKNPSYLVGYIRALLRHDSVGEAGERVKQLVALRPEAFEAAVLKARVVHAEGHTAEAATVIQAFAAAGKGTRLVMAAALLEEFGRPEEAERLYREFAATAGRPDAALPLAGFLGNTGRIPGALAICEPAWRNCPPEAVARVCVAAVRQPQATDEHRRRVEKWLRDAIAKHPQMVVLQVTLADLYDAGGRHDEAMALYRRILQTGPDNVVALNNLAFVLTMRGDQPDEALALVNRAIDIAGPLPEFLDTRAVIYLKTKQGELAVKDLQQAIAQVPLANVYYHLAAAQLAAKNRSAAGDAFRKATAAKLKPTDLHPLEQSAYRELAEVLRFE
jgi:tetratricopeptide (TPR) repeat protein